MHALFPKFPAWAEYADAIFCLACQITPGSQLVGRNLLKPPFNSMTTREMEPRNFMSCQIVYFIVKTPLSANQRGEDFH